MNTKPCMSSHNKSIIILIYTKDSSDTEGCKNQTNFVAQKMAASEVLSAQCFNRTLRHPLRTCNIASFDAKLSAKCCGVANFNLMQVCTSHCLC